jgi:hypothetical protein
MMLVVDLLFNEKKMRAVVPVIPVFYSVFCIAVIFFLALKMFCVAVFYSFPHCHMFLWTGKSAVEFGQSSVDS